MHGERAQGATFQSPDGTIAVSFSIVGFVDDSNCQVNAFHDDSQRDNKALLRAATRDVQLWADLLWLSGGYLELPKCSFHLIAYKFDKRGAPFLKSFPSGQARIVIKDPKTGAPVEITHLSSATAHKTLGHWLEPCGRGVQQMKKLKSKVQDISF